MVSACWDRPSTSGRGKQGPPDAVALSTVLARTVIDEPTYRRFRAALLSIGYLEVDAAPGYVAFAEDAMLDNLFRVDYVRPGQSPPPLRSEFVDGTELVSLRRLAGP